MLIILIKIHNRVNKIKVSNYQVAGKTLNQQVKGLILIEIQKMSGMLNSHEEAIANLKPPIFWKDKTAYVQQLRKWNLEKLNELAYKIGETETLIKKNSQIRSDIIIKNLIINVSLKASSSF